MHETTKVLGDQMMEGYYTI